MQPPEAQFVDRVNFIVDKLWVKWYTWVINKNFRRSILGVTRNGGGNGNAVGHVEGSRAEGAIKTISPPSNTPAETVKISPENLIIANSYLASQSILDVSRNLGIGTELITDVLAKREVKAYIDAIFLDMGFNNRFKLRDVMDAVINKKLQEMDESDLGSQKDIIEIMALSHKMSMDTLDRQIKLEEAKAKNAPGIKNQVNIQNNDSGGTRYDTLIERLMRGDS